MLEATKPHADPVFLVHKFGFSEYYHLLQWVRSLIGNSHNITNFGIDWTDGTALCALMEALVPGCCPRHDTLHPQHELVNLDLGLRLAEKHLGVETKLKAEEIAYMKKNVDQKLQSFVAALRAKGEKLNVKSSRESLNSEQYYCFAKGLGLIMATKGQRASFTIYIQTKHLCYIVIEIEGPNSDYYTEIITHRSPNNKRQILLTLPNEDFPRPENSIIKLSNGRLLNIPFEYDILPDRILVSYIPLSVGRYIVSIYYKGQPIYSSPFNVTVYDASPRSDRNKTLKWPKKRLANEAESLGSFDNVLPSNSSQSPSLIRTKPLFIIVFRKYANIILKPGEPLPPDPRAWRALEGPEVSETDLPNDILSLYNERSVKENASPDDEQTLSNTPKASQSTI